MTHQEAISLFKEVKQGEILLTIGRRNSTTTNTANTTNDEVNNAARSNTTSRKKNVSGAKEGSND